ncbi:hypothetical protein A4A58_05875 [Tardiphaga robiniae]|uniref:Uncharacterized protein n=2 Tax=Tardiphaga robiniae TaxID=943830 RepID=A0A163Z5I9_9BRAD|nr:hypothetical protein A4A58_05875 [Tardiphaga robiniae]
MSGGALVFSALSLYFSVLRETDDLRLIVSKLPDVQLEDRDHLSINNEFSLSLINGGNRPAVILRYTLLVDQGIDDGYCSDRAIWFHSDTAPIIVKAGEALSAGVELKGPDEESTQVKAAKGRWTIPISDRSEEDFAHVRLCLELEVATPSLAYERVQLKILQGTGRLDKDTPFLLLTEDLSRPHKVIQHWGFSFLK